MHPKTEFPGAGSRCLFYGFVVLALISCLDAVAEIPKPDDAPQPLSPEDSKKHFTLPEGFRIDLVASEPLIADPSCVAWDEKGRLFVTEIHGYNLEGHLDVTELNKTGELDTAIRRVRVGPEMKKQAVEGQSGSLKLLKDHDGDGKMDEAIVWAEDIPAAYGVVPALGGLIITASPDILFFADTDGDDLPDVRKVLFTGFSPGEMERAINNPVWGPDNWIYAGRGWGGGTITGPNLKRTVELERTDFRFKADGTAIEPVSGSNHTFGMAFDDFGNRWLITTSQHARYAAPLPHRYLIRNPHVAAPDTSIGASSYGNTFPTSKPHPWRRKRGADPRWVKFYGAGEAQPNGNFTSACGQLVYRAGLLPEEFRGNHFACDPQQSMVHRSIIERDGAGLRVRRPDEHRESEFLSSSDGWFRPNNLRTGPDGAIFIVDMYREIIEDYSAIPRYLQQQYGLLNGSDRGRIWRLAPEASGPARTEVANVGSVESLKHPNAWWRETAQRLLIDSGERAPVGEVRNIVRDTAAPWQARIHALYTLAGLGAINLEDVLAALAAPHPALRVQALRADLPVSDALVAMAKSESDPNVLLQIALSLGDSSDSAAIEALAHLAATKLDIRWMDSAILSSIGKAPAHVLQDRIGQVSRHPPRHFGKKWLRRSRGPTVQSGGEAIFDAVISHPNSALRLRLLEIAAEHKLIPDQELRKLADAAFGHVWNGRSSEAERLTALRIIPMASSEGAAAAVQRVLEPTQSPEFQEKAVRSLMTTDSSVVAEVLVSRLPSATPRLAAVVVEVLLAHRGATLKLLESEAASAKTVFAVAASSTRTERRCEDRRCCKTFVWGRARGAPCR